MSEENKNQENLNKEDKPKKPWHKQWWFYAVALIVLFNMGGNDEQTKERPKLEMVKEEKKEEKKEPKKEEKVPEELEPYAEFVINEIAGAESNHDGEYKKRIQELYVFEEELFVEVMVDDNFTKDRMKTQFLSESKEIFEKVFKKRKDVPKMEIQWLFPNGELHGIFAKIQMSKETADKIDWENFTHSQLPDVTDSYLETDFFKNY